MNFAYEPDAEAIVEGVELMADKELGVDLCGMSHPRLSLVCDLPEGHDGDHRSRSYIAGLAGGTG